MIYEFQADDGEIIQENFPMKFCPEIGTPLVRDGKTYKRIFSRGGLLFNDAQVATTVHGYPRTDVTLPKGDDVGGGMDPEGRPIIRSQAHEREVMARYGMRRD